MRPFCLTTLCVALSACVAHAAPTLKILGSIEGHKPQPAWVFARKGEKVTLHAQLSPELRKAKLRWLRIEPTTRSADNTHPSFHWADIAYATTELEACSDQPTCEADVTPRALPRNPHLEGLGTMAFQLEATLPDGRRFTTPGVDSRDRGGLSRHVFRVAIRRDDSYLGYLTELVNTPYIFGSAGAEGNHQADLLVGSDCADLAVYGIRRTGKNVPYVSTWTIEKHAPLVAVTDARDGAGAFVDRRGKPLTLGATKRVRTGDLLLFPETRHVGVLWEDRPPLGVLDDNDLLLHTCWAPPTVERVGSASCASLPIRVLRFE